MLRERQSIDRLFGAAAASPLLHRRGSYNLSRSDDTFTRATALPTPASPLITAKAHKKDKKKKRDEKDHSPT